MYACGNCFWGTDTATPGACPRCGVDLLPFGTKYEPKTGILLQVCQGATCDDCPTPRACVGGGTCIGTS